MKRCGNWLRILTAGVMCAGALPAAAEKSEIPGYTYGTSKVQRAPVSLQELELLKKTVLFSDDDAKYLKMSQDVLKDQTDAILDVWYGFVASNPHLVYYFGNKSDGKPNAEYLAAVRKRFDRWILDTARADFDQAWLDYQFEIGRRHRRGGKNKTDRVKSVDNIGYRYIPALIYPITATLKPFLAKKGNSPEDVEKMHQAWIKAVILSVTLWSYPYVNPKDY